jgi:PilZ domain
MDMRQEERVRLIYYLRLFQEGSRDPLGHLINVTGDGFMLMGEREMRPNIVYQLAMDLPPHMGRGTQMRFTGEVKWRKSPDRTPFYHTGIKFIEIAPRDRELLEHMARDFYREDIEQDISEDMNPPENAGEK